MNIHWPVSLVRRLAPAMWNLQRLTGALFLKFLYIEKKKNKQTNDSRNKYKY